MRKVVSSLLIFLLCINMMVEVHAGDFASSFYIEYDGGVHKYNSRLVTIVVNNQEVETGDMPGIVIDSRTLVPVREVFESESINAQVDWNGDRQEVYITYKDVFIVLTIDSQVAMVNGEPVELDVPAKLIRDMNKTYAKTMVPLRFISEVLEFDVGWEPESFTAVLTGEEVVANIPDTTVNDSTSETEEDQTQVVADNTAADGEQLSSLTDAGASRALPTALKNNPVIWTANSEQLAIIEESYVETTLTDENHEPTVIEEVSYDDSTEVKQFVVEASSAISEVDYFVWNNKFIIDISNAENEVAAETPYEDNPIVSSVRASQYSLEPLATRIVLDLLDGGNKFTLSFNEDRTELIVQVMDNSIKAIELGQNTIGDFIKVSGVAAPDANMFRLSNPDRIVIDFPNTKTLLGYNESEADGQYVRKIRTAQFDTTTTRIVVETDGQADYEITKAASGETIIQFKEPGYENIAYENIEKPTISLTENEQEISLEGVVYNNDYMNRKFTITLSKDYGSLFGDGSLKVNDGIIDTVEVNKTSEGKTEIVIQSTTVYEYRVEEVDDTVQIKAYKPKELYSNIVVVDAGHGGKDPGAIAPKSMATDFFEKDVNLDIALLLKKIFDTDENMKVYYTRVTDVYPSLQDRVDLANEVEADLFLSIHNNAFLESYTGTETLYFPSEISSTLTSKGLADIYQKKVVEYTGSNDRGLKDRENLFVLKHTTMPAVIVEVGYLTNMNDLANLKNPDFLQKVATALYMGTQEAFNLYPTRR